MTVAAQASSRADSILQNVVFVRLMLEYGGKEGKSTAIGSCQSVEKNNLIWEYQHSRTRNRVWEDGSIYLTANGELLPGGWAYVSIQDCTSFVRLNQYGW